jgi:hypothetical protein
LRINFEVIGHDENGSHFSAHGQTRNVSREGGCLVLDRDMKHGDIVKLRSPKGIPFIAHVCWSTYDMQKNLRRVGFKLTSNHGWVLHETAHNKPTSLFFLR